MPPSSSKTAIVHSLTLGVVCFLAITPFFWYGSPSGHDFEFHMSSWMEVLNQWKQGIVYPRWAALAHWGSGEARFLFYPPASWTLGAALGALLPWKMVPGAYAWLVLTLAGLSMYRLAREWLPPADALFAAALYAVNPYHLLIVYWRSAFAELLASALLPLLLLCILRISDRGVRPVLWLGLVLAATWLTNAPAAVLIHYSAAGLAVVLAVLERSWRPLVKSAMAVALGAGLAAFYLIPAAYEEGWVNIGEVLAPGVRPYDNFLFTKIADVEHNLFNLLVSYLASAEIALFAAAVWFSRQWRVRLSRPWVLLSCWGALAVLAMLPMTSLLWEHLPKLRFVQLPWRWLLCLNAVLVILLTMAARRWSVRVLAGLALLAVLLAAGHRTQPPWWDTAADIGEMTDAIADRSGYEGTDEYVPAGADSYELKKDQPLVADSSGLAAQVDAVEWGPAEWHVVMRAEKPELFTLRLFNYPAWDVTVNGKRLEAKTAEVTGQIEIPVTAGRIDIRIYFGRTRDRTVGGWVSLLSLCVLLALWAKQRCSPPRIPVFPVAG